MGSSGTDGGTWLSPESGSEEREQNWTRTALSIAPFLSLRELIQGSDRKHGLPFLKHDKAATPTSRHLSL